MSTARHKPHLSLTSKSGATHFSMRASRKTLRNILLGVTAIGLLAFGSFGFIRKVWGVKEGAIGSVYELPAGPWGDLTAQPILIEAPQSMLSPNFRLGDGRWHFAATNAAEVDALLRAAGLSPAQSASLLPALQPVAGRADLMAVTPPAELVRGLSPEIRSRLYEKLALIPENFAQVEPFRITAIHLDDWLDSPELPGEVVAQVRSLLWRRGNGFLFSDYNLVADSLASPVVKLELLRQLTRKASLVIKLEVPDQSEVDSLVDYWGVHGRRDKVRPILSSLARSGGGQLDISNLLPVFARQRLYRFADPLPGTELGPACHWSAFNFFNMGPVDDSLHTPEGVEKVLGENYAPATGEPRFGDIILLTLPDGSSIHSAVYVADGIVFTKNGPSLATPFLFSTMEDMLAFYPSSERITLTYYRRK